MEGTRKGGGGASTTSVLRTAATLVLLAGSAQSFVTAPASSSCSFLQQPSALSRRTLAVGDGTTGAAAAAAAAGAAGAGRKRRSLTLAARGSEEWENASGGNGGSSGNDVGRENSWATQAQGDDDWSMDTPRIHYLREMEKLGQELHDMTGVGTGGAADLQSLVVSTPSAPAQAHQVPFPPPSQAAHAAASEHEKAVREIAMQEEMRRSEVLVAESCAINWREEPVFSRPVGFVPGNRKVQQVKLSGDRVMYGSDAGVVGLASALDGRELFRAPAHTALVTALDYDASSGWMISAADDGVVKVFRDVGGEGGRARVEAVGGGMRHHSNRVVSAEILDHRWGLTASMDGKIAIFELEGGGLVQEMWASDTLLAASVCKGYVFAGLMGGPVEAFSIRNGGRSAFRYIAQRTPVRSLCTFPLAGNNIRVVVGGQDGALRQFQVRPVMSTEGVWKMPRDRSFDDRLILVCNTHVDQDTREVDQGFVLKGHKAPVVAVACDEDKVVSASEDGSIIVWNTAKSTPRYSVRRHVDGDLVGAVDFNERYLVYDGTPGKVMVWDYAFGPPPRKASGSSAAAAATGLSGLGSGGKSRRGSSPGARGSRGSGGGQHRRRSSSSSSSSSSPSSRKDGASQQGQGGTPPPSASSSDDAANGGPRPNFPFLGGWNLGHGPTDLEGVGGVSMGGMHQQQQQQQPSASSSADGIVDNEEDNSNNAAASEESGEKGHEGEGSA